MQKESAVENCEDPHLSFLDFGGRGKYLGESPNVHLEMQCH